MAHYLITFLARNFHITYFGEPHIWSFKIQILIGWVHWYCLLHKLKLRAPRSYQFIIYEGLIGYNDTHLKFYWRAKKLNVSSGWVGVVHRLKGGIWLHWLHVWQVLTHRDAPGRKVEENILDERCMHFCMTYNINNGVFIH